MASEAQWWAGLGENNCWAASVSGHEETAGLAGSFRSRWEPDTTWGMVLPGTAAGSAEQVHGERREVSARSRWSLLVSDPGGWKEQDGKCLQVNSERGKAGVAALTRDREHRQQRDGNGSFHPEPKSSVCDNFSHQTPLRSQRETFTASLSQAWVEQADDS